MRQLGFRGGSGSSISSHSNGLSVTEAPFSLKWSSARNISWGIIKLIARLLLVLNHRCALSYGSDGGRKLAYGTDSGIYVSDRKPHSNAKTTPMRVHALPNVTQIDVLEEYGLLLVLCDKTLSSYPIELLTEPDNATKVDFQMNRKAKKVSSHVNFFKAGICLGRVFLCVVKSSGMSSTIKVMEPVEGLNRGRGKLGFAKLLQGGQDFKIYKVHFLRLFGGQILTFPFRSSISPPNQHRYISSNQNYALAVPRALKSWIWII